MTRLHWRALLSALLAGSTFLWCGTAYGQQLDACDPKNPVDCVVPLLAGQAVPFNGLLLGPRRAAVVTVKAEQCQERIDLGVAEERERGAIKIQAEKDRRTADNDHFDDRLAAQKTVMEAYKEKFAPHWYEAPELWFCIGFVTAGLITAGAVAIVSATRPAVVTVP